MSGKPVTETLDAMLGKIERLQGALENIESHFGSAEQCKEIARRTLGREVARCEETELLRKIADEAELVAAACQFAPQINTEALDGLLAEYREDRESHTVPKS